ncbi:MAG: hypothetical protein NTAFB05_30060 [Nitrobacter sp.]|uniref:hypothetical protein n=1 Tax=Nitrobacter sp. TaxID=29420 RepID=UPI00387DFC90
MIFGSAFVVALATLPMWGTPVWHIWELDIRPRLIPAETIQQLADKLVALHGSRAEEMAFIEEDRAWRYSETFEQRKWRRVRHELARRYEAKVWPNRRQGGL